MNNYQKYKAKLQEIADYRFAVAALEWDKETYMPKGGSEQRSRQIATLTTAAHNLFTHEKMGNLLDHLSADDSLTFIEKRNIERTSKEYKKAHALSAEFVNKKSMAISRAYQAWIAAREANDFQVYQADLDNIVQILKEEVDTIGYQHHPYNTLLDIYEPDMNVAFLDDFFGQIIMPIRSLIQKINNSQKADDSFLFKKYNKDQQWDFGMEVLRDIGYDFNHGRQDLSTHPFTTSFGPEDVRVTTRIDENNFADMLWSTIHEGGHALYEQGLPTGDHYGLPSGTYNSLGIHESQSRLWENHVARSFPFWQHYYPRLQQVFPEQLKNIELNQFYRATNKIKPNLIRTDSDELHYHIHVYIRYELEKQLIEGSLQTKDLNEAWNAMYAEHMNIEVPDDRQGLLQDIHWALGSIGYFPTYSLGTFYAAQFYHATEKNIPDLQNQIKQGKFNDLLSYLRQNIHRHGQTYSANENCKDVTGEILNPKYFLDYVARKYGEMHDRR